MAVLTPTAITRAGHSLAGAPADVAGDSFANTGHEYVVVKNTDAASHTVTFAVQATLDGLSVSGGKVVTVEAGATKIIGPFPPNIYNNAATGRVAMSYDAVTSVSVAVFKAA